MSDGRERENRPDGHHRTGAGEVKSLFRLAFAFVWETGRAVASALVRGLSGHDHSPPASAAFEAGGRDADRNLAPVRETAAHRRRGVLLVVCALAVAIAAGVGFLFAYWMQGDNPLLGGCLALFLGGIGCSLVLYARWLMLRREAIEPREELPSSEPERAAFAEDFSASVGEIHRRGLLITVALAFTGLVAAIVVSLFRSLGKPPGPELFTYVWKSGQRLMTSEGAAVSVQALQPGSTMIVFPEGSIGDEQAQTVLIRVKEQLLQLPAGRSRWAPMGYVAYSRVCTHAGCPVGMFEATRDLLMCPCHQSTFDVLRGAVPTAGPAARALPQLPLYADADGILRAATGFTEPPGPGFWGMPS